MNKARVLLMVAVFLGAIQGTASPQQDKTKDQTEPKPDFIEVKVYQAFKITGVQKSDGTFTGAVKEDAIGPERRTKLEAESDEEKWNNEHPGNLVQTTVKEKTVKTPVGKLMEAKDALDKVKEAKEAVDKAKKIIEKGVAEALAEERKLGDTLKEYGTECLNAMARADEAKKRLTELAKKVSRKDIEEVNKLIGSYNESRQRVGKVERELNALKDERSKAVKQPNAKVEIQITGVPDQPLASALDKFPAMAPLDPKDFKDKLEPEKPAGKYVVWVYKMVDGKWVKQEDQSFTSNDQKEAEKYLDEAKSKQGQTVTSNLPKPPLAGTKWLAYYYFPDVQKEDAQRQIVVFNSEDSFTISHERQYFNDNGDALPMHTTGKVSYSSDSIILTQSDGYRIQLTMRDEKMIGESRTSNGSVVKWKLVRP